MMTTDMTWSHRAIQPCPVQPRPAQPFTAVLRPAPVVPVVEMPYHTAARTTGVWFDGTPFDATGLAKRRSAADDRTGLDRDALALPGFASFVVTDGADERTNPGVPLPAG